MLLFYARRKSFFKEKVCSVNEAKKISTVYQQKTSVMNKKHLAFLGVSDYSVTTPIQKEVLDSETGLLLLIKAAIQEKIAM